MTTLTTYAAVTGILVFFACGGKTSHPGAPETDTDKFSYAIGYRIAKQIEAQQLEVNETMLTQGISDVLNSDSLQMTPQEMTQILIDKQSEEMAKRANSDDAVNNLKAAKAFLKENAEKEGVLVTDSGLQYKMLKEGSGKRPLVTDRVLVHYRGTLIDGTEFDSSYKRNKPAEFTLNSLIKGWTEGLQLLKEGGKIQLFVPPELGYGISGSGPIPSNSCLIFEVELLDIVN